LEHEIDVVLRVEPDESDFVLPGAFRIHRRARRVELAENDRRDQRALLLDADASARRHQPELAFVIDGGGNDLDRRQRREAFQDGIDDITRRREPFGLRDDPFPVAALELDCERVLLEAHAVDALGNGFEKWRRLLDGGVAGGVALLRDTGEVKRQHRGERVVDRDAQPAHSAYLRRTNTRIPIARNRPGCHRTATRNMFSASDSLMKNWFLPGAFCCGRLPMSSSSRASQLTPLTRRSLLPR